MKNWIYSLVTIIELMLNLSYYWCFLILFHYQYKDITFSKSEPKGYTSKI